MKFFLSTLVVLSIACLSLLLGCQTPQIEDDGLSYQLVSFDRDYDEVWDALEKIMIDKMMLPIKIKDKEHGVIQSDWVSVIRIRGTMRWYVKAFVERGQKATTVRLSHVAEVPTEVMGTMKDNKGDVKTGWQSSRETIREVNEILSLLTRALQ